ncbi:ATP-binding protein [Desertifilum sp. FACHB-1129]|uniref:ATPase n=1 Tax=Desertifilum tharense IPPAS B-1220 TaxID=1781255 RepID=A0A1E5QN38_9CYAN|nr:MULTISPECIES: ATP-binding protein [Desertifilum]MDA0213060.1 ATP-binding protein [Cyanobacteria bacterium FC1]MBD2312374.1 ATP-binding protein [Desertifilum sp. FACHB-1129]MBD2321157.1 ATP-binding protein [Desertifilum sp. FACHB-866]MBD2331536.1 ATP-binding protein [Desertifilum sp. FACHB-868]OEJ76048.1 ATPase [Desertifilum tharense IPPAS B-1220]
MTAQSPLVVRNIIGTVKGPGETGNQYVFITSDNRQVRIGEFVYYSGIDGNTSQEILGKISALRLIDHLPDRMFADPEISPEAIAAFVGFTYENPELYEVTVDIIGYFHPALGFVNPRRIPDPGTKVALASDESLRQILCRKQPGEVGSANIGSVLLRKGGAVPVVLDVKEIVSTHLAILAGTGSGKSYTAGVLIEELLLPYNRAPVLIFDPHGEYGTLAEIQGHPAFQSQDGYAPRVKVLTPDRVRIRMSSLDYYDIQTLLPQMSDRQQAILHKAFISLKKRTNLEHRWDIEDLIQEVHDADRQVDEEGNEKLGSSAPAIEWKLEKLKHSPYFHALHHLAPRDLFEPGQVTVFQMNEISQEEQQVICAAILRQAYHARINTQKEKISPGDENYLPFPVFILLEEAHRFAPAHDPSRCKAVLRTILSEGRKFGLGVGLITQRPGKLDSDVLSQCMSQFLMRIINPVDQDSLKHGVEAAGRDLLKELPALTKGQVIISGACVNTPVLCQVRKRLTQHGGDTLNAPMLWQGYFQTHQLEQREAEAAPLVGRGRSQTVNGRSIE